MTRKTIHKKTEIAILTKSHRRCALCFHLDFDFKYKKGQIAHIDRDHKNNAEENLVYLCLKHHDEYDTMPSQSKRFKPEELKKAKSELEHNISKHASELFSVTAYTELLQNRSEQSVPVDVYKLRLPVYRAFNMFLSSIVQENEVSGQIIFDFLQDTHDALFLFDEAMVAYLHQIYSKALLLRRLNLRLKHPKHYNEKQWGKIVDDEMNCFDWLTNQLVEGKDRFNKYLNISGQRVTAPDSENGNDEGS